MTFSTGEGKRIVAQVDLKNEKVMELRTFGITVTFPPNPETDLELSQAEREEAMEIAVSVPALQEFLVNGWEVTHVLGHLFDGRKVADVGIIPNQDFLGVITTDGYYMIDGKSVRVDLDRKEVTSVSEFGIIINASVTAIPSE